MRLRPAPGLDQGGEALDLQPGGDQVRGHLHRDDRDQNPEAAALKAGIVLAPEEVEAIRSVSRDQAMKFAEEFENRIVKRWMG
jgi:hypothetical protein